MPCLLGCLALLTPRIVIVLLFLFSDYLAQAYQTTIWPVLGFLFMPLTTLAYAFAVNNLGGASSGTGLLIVIFAVLIDLGVIGGGASNKKVRKVVYVKKR